MIIIRLPIPPSTNSLYYNRGKSGGRGKTNHYRRWIAEADKCFLMQKRALLGKIPMIGKLHVHIRVPPDKRSDIDNRLKAMLDWLVSRNITEDDRNYTKVSIEVDDQLQTRECWIEVREA